SGNSLRVNLGDAKINNNSLVNIDCYPPAPYDGTSSCDTTLASFAAIGLPADSGTSIIFATSPTRAVYRMTVQAGPPATVAITALKIGGPSCPTCPPFVSVMAWDVDGDHQLDILALDQSLNLYVSLSTVDPTLSTITPVTPQPIAAVNTGLNTIQTSMSG